MKLNHLKYFSLFIFNFLGTPGLPGQSGFPGQKGYPGQVGLAGRPGKVIYLKKEIRSTIVVIWFL